MSIAQPIAGPMPHTPEWFALRLQTIGASESAAACGFSEYQTPLGLYLEKRGLVEPQDDNDSMRLGRALEPVVLAEYEHHEGIPVRSGLPSYLHPEHKFLSATPDAEAMVPDVWPEDRPLVEAKTTTTWRVAAKFGDHRTDEVPDEILFQCQHQMLVMGRAQVDVPVLIDGRSYRLYRVHRDVTFQAGLLELLGDFWARVEREEPPEPDWENKSTSHLVRKLARARSDGAIELTEEQAEDWLELSRVKDQIAALESRRDVLRDKLLWVLGDHACGMLPRGEALLVKSLVPDSWWTEADVELARAKVGQIKRSGYVQLRQRKLKKGS